MNPVRIYDYLTMSRGKVLAAVGGLSAEAYERTSEIGPGTLARTLTHMMISEWYYVQRLLEREVPAYAEWPIKDEAPPSFGVIEATWREQAIATRSALAGVGDWGVEIEYEVTDDDGVRQIVTTSRGDLVTQLVLHEMHHRAQVLNMLRRLGVEIGEIDFNAGWPRREA